MSLNAALVDRARRLVDTPRGQKVEGTTIFTTITEPWFKCRLTYDPAPESDDQNSGERRTPRPAQMLCGIRDTDRGTLAISGADKIEVNSKQLGRAVFQVTGDPEPIRKKRRVIGWQVTLTRVEEHAFRNEVA